MMAATIRDVAKRAGVSIATVSKVFNGYTDVNQKTKEKILLAANELDYAPNMAARTLSSKKHKTIALILNELAFTRKSTMPMEVLSGVYKFTEETDYEFVFYGTSSEKQTQKTFQQFCSEHNITGAVVQGLKITDPYYLEIQRTRIPVVLIDLSVDHPNVGTVSIDNEKAANEAVSYLIKKNHRQIAMINGSEDASVSLWREAGYRSALHQAGIDVNEEFICYADYDENVAFMKTCELVRQHPEITALFCASDVMAIGALHAIQEQNLRVPQDISIIGFDDIILASYVTPKLSSVEQDMEKMGYEAGKLLSKIINKTANTRQHTTDHRLIIRESVIQR